MKWPQYLAQLQHVHSIYMPPAECHEWISVDLCWIQAKKFSLYSSEPLSDSLQLFSSKFKSWVQQIWCTRRNSMASEANLSIQVFFTCKGRGIRYVAVHKETATIAYAEKVSWVPERTSQSDFQSWSAAAIYLQSSGWTQQGLHPRLFIHEAESFKQTGVITEGPEILYTSIGFSSDGKLLATCGESPDPTVVVWDWRQVCVKLEGANYTSCRFHLRQ